MSALGVDVFDRTVQVTNSWLREIMQDHGPDRQIAWHILGTVRRTLRDRLPTDLSAHLGAQLPLLVRGTYYEQFEPSLQPSETDTLAEFLDKVEKGFAMTRPVDTTEAVRSVFKVLSHYIDPGQVAKVRAALPKEVRQLWPDSMVRH